MSSHSQAIKANLVVRPDVTLMMLWSVLKSFADRFDVELDIEVEDLPIHGAMPFCGDSDELELEPDGKLWFNLECWSAGPGVMPDRVEDLCVALGKLLATGGTVEIIDLDTSPANDDARAFRCIGPTPAAAVEARVIHGMDLARDALLGVMDQASFEQLVHQAKTFATANASTAQDGGKAEGDGDKFVEILQHRISWHLGGDAAAPSELPESCKKHIESLIKEGYNQGELLASSDDGETDFSGWWSIDHS